MPLDEETIVSAPLLRAVGRVSAGAENIDTEACARASSAARRSASSAWRRPRDRWQLLGAFGARVIGYDPALHASDPLWARWQVQPLPLSELFRASDGVCVLLASFSRYRGLLGERFLAVAKPNQVLVCFAHSSVFDEHALADALLHGRLSAARFDSLEPGMLDPGRPLRQVDTLQVTPRVAATTRESRQRSAWAVARRIDELLEAPSAATADFRSTIPDALADLEADSLSP